MSRNNSISTPKYLCLALLAVTLIPASCKKDVPQCDEPEITIEQTEFTLGSADNRTATVSFTATADWTITVTQGAEWLSASTTGGTAGSQSVELTAQEYTGQTPRTASADIVCGEQSVKITVTQSGQEIVIEQTEYTLDASDNRTATVSFTTTADWTITVTQGAEWLTATPASGTAGSQSVELTALEHIETTPRTATAEIACPGKTVQITVTQTGMDYTSQFDPHFASVLQKLGIIQDAGNITRQDMDNIAAQTELSILFPVVEQPMTSIKGIEHFKSLTKLDCSWNLLQAVDLSENTALVELYINNNELTSLDLSRNTSLQYLDCSRNKLTSLGVSSNPELERLRCFNNRLTSLDVSNNPDLGLIFCSGNLLTSLDLSSNVSLDTLYCFSNTLTSLDISHNPDLTLLDASSCDLTSLDISKNRALKDLYVEYNPGDGVSAFPITAWFTDPVFAPGFRVMVESWYTEGKNITVQFRKAEE